MVGSSDHRSLWNRMSFQERIVCFRAELTQHAITEDSGVITRPLAALNVSDSVRETKPLALVKIVRALGSQRRMRDSSDADSETNVSVNQLLLI